MKSNKINKRNMVLMAKAIQRGWLIFTDIPYNDNWDMDYKIIEW